MDTDIFDLLTQNFWVLGLIVGLLNTAIKWVQLRPRMKASPELAPGYITLLRGFWLISTVPWLSMGIGMVWGNVPTMWHFFYPSSGNPFVIAWWVIYWGWVSILAYWMLFNGGAQMLVSHPGFLRGNPKNPKWLKLGLLLALMGSAIATVLVFNHPMPSDLSTIAG